MAISIGAAPDFKPLRTKWRSTSSDTVNKLTYIKGDAADADVIVALTAMDNLSNAAFTGKYDGRLISGQKADPTAALQSLVSVFMQLNFEAANPVNPAKPIQRSFTLPAYKEALVSAGVPLYTTPGTGSPEAYNGALIAFLEENLTAQAADLSWVTGFEYVGGGFGSGNDVIGDGV